MADIYEGISEFAKREKEEAEKAVQTEKKQVCIKADSYIAKEIKYQTALLHQILDRLNEIYLLEKKGNGKMFPVFELRKNMNEMICQIEQLIIDEYEAMRQKGKTLWGIEEFFRQISFENPELAVHIRKRMLQIAKEKGDLP